MTGEPPSLLGAFHFRVQQSARTSNISGAAGAPGGAGRKNVIDLLMYQASMIQIIGPKSLHSLAYSSENLCTIPSSIPFSRAKNESYSMTVNSSMSGSIYGQ